MSVGLIPRHRLQRIPAELRLAHEFCFFLHDEGVRLLVQYEAAEANVVTVKFRSKVKAAKFAELAKESSIDALRATGYPKQARRVILNQITMAMVSDCLHHIYEALRCIEKRKTVVGLNLLRKPLLDSLLYLSWMLGDEDGFYKAFTEDGPEALTPKRMGNHRANILAAALAQTKIDALIEASFINAALFDAKNASGMYGLFQHAVHLVTVDRIELRTQPENFNFIFKSYSDDDLYHGVYGQLPAVLLYLSHVIMELFDRVKRMDKGAKHAFIFRSTLAYHVLEGGDAAQEVQTGLGPAFSKHFQCDRCAEPLVLTQHNAARAVLSESFRCTKCQRINHLPFSWLF